VLRTGATTVDDLDRDRVLTLAVLIGVAYTVFSEWLNTQVRGTWAYARRCHVCRRLGRG
jgi:hypothetical protein